MHTPPSGIIIKYSSNWEGGNEDVMTIVQIKNERTCKESLLRKLQMNRSHRSQIRKADFGLICIIITTEILVPAE